MTACTVLYTDDVQLSTDMCSFQLASTNSNSCTVVMYTTYHVIAYSCTRYTVIHASQSCDV